MFITTVARMCCKWAYLITRYTFISAESIFYCRTEYYRVGRVAGCCAVLLLSVKKYSVHCIALLPCYVALIGSYG